MLIGSCDQTERGFSSSWDPDFPAPSQVNPRTSWRDGGTYWLDPSHEPTSLVGGWAAGTVEST